MLGTGYVLVAGGTSSSGITNTAQTSGPYLYAWGANGARHQVQVTSYSGGDWNTSFTLGFLYDSTPYSVTYDWVGGFGASLRATVRDGAGTLLGTSVTAHKGSSTFTNADGSVQVTDNRNLVTYSHISALDERVIVLGPERTMYLPLFDYLSSITKTPFKMVEWFYAARADVFADLTNQQQADLWNAIADTEQLSLTSSDPTNKFKVRADTNETASGGWIEMQDCTQSPVNTRPICGQPWTNIAWFSVDVVRAHYQISHPYYPQFFLHHRKYIDQMENWILNVWLADPGKGANPGYNLSGTAIMPYGHMPYWNSAHQINDSGHSPGQNFLYTPLPGGTNTWSLVYSNTNRNCHTGTQCTTTSGSSCSTHGSSGGGMSGGFAARVDTKFNPTPLSPQDPSNGCDWEASQSFGNPTYTLDYGDTGPTSGLCTQNEDLANGIDDFMNFTQTNGQNCTAYQQSQGFFAFHGCVHTHLVSTVGTQNFFGAQDSPAVPLFFPWHAWVDHFYGMRLDCHGS